MNQEDQDGVQPDGDEEGQPDDDQDTRNVGQAAHQEVGHRDAEGARQTYEEWRAVIEGASERAQGLIGLVELPLHARWQDQDAIGRGGSSPTRGVAGSPVSNVIVVSQGVTYPIAGG